MLHDTILNYGNDAETVDTTNQVKITRIEVIFYRVLLLKV
jgi:hypothetical protein